MKARRWWWAAWLWPCVALATPGSWSRATDGPRVAGANRDYTTARLTPRWMRAAGRIRRVHWQFALPAGRHVRAWLCSGNQCMRLPHRRGVSRALAGADAARPLTFHFRLPANTQQPVQVGRVRLIVDYQ